MNICNIVILFYIYRGVSGYATRGLACSRSPNSLCFWPTALVGQLVQNKRKQVSRDRLCLCLFFVVYLFCCCFCVCVCVSPERAVLMLVHVCGAFRDKTKPLPPPIKNETERRSRGLRSSLLLLLSSLFVAVSSTVVLLAAVVMLVVLLLLSLLLRCWRVRGRANWTLDPKVLVVTVVLAVTRVLWPSGGERRGPALG